MRFQVIPAIDVFGGRLARYTAEGPVAVDAYEGDPAAAAASFTPALPPWIHVVDMDLAFTGSPANLGAITQIARLGIPVQAGGGARSEAHVDALLAAGAARVILGSAALADRGTVGALVGWHGDRLAVGIEMDGQRIRSRGADPIELPLEETLRWLVMIGARRLIVTAVTRVGGLSGPDLDAVASAVATGVPVVASGGVATAAHVRAVRATGAEGVIVGRAIVEGGLDLTRLGAEADG